MQRKVSLTELQEAAAELLSPESVSSWPSVCRIQLNPGFTLQDAKGMLDYWQDLGLGGMYLSPILQALPGSTHGYNVTEPGQVNTSLGGNQAFEAFSAEASSRGMKILLDIVPNHMGVHSSNSRWWDVLEHGRNARSASFFDISWESDERERVLLPVLGEQFGKVLERGELKLAFTNGSFSLHYYDKTFPICPDTWGFILEQRLLDLRAVAGQEHPELMRLESQISAANRLPSRSNSLPEAVEERYHESEVLRYRFGKLLEESPVIRDYLDQTLQLFNGNPGNPESFDLLEELVLRQPYRLASWRVANEEINYRRFFDINDLVALRMELPHVFDYLHSLIFSWLERGLIHGLRLDHTDGLYDPPGYFDKLQRSFFRILLQRKLKTKGLDLGPSDANLVDSFLETLQPIPRVLPVLIEKILERKENLPEEWAVSGSVGYDFLNLLNGLFVSREAQDTFDAFYRKFTHQHFHYEDLLYEQKKKIVQNQMPGEINVLALKLKRISSRDRLYQDFTYRSIVRAITEIMACFPVYRTYISPHQTEPSPRDEQYIHIAVQKAQQRNPQLSRSLFGYIFDVLTLKVKGKTHEEDARYRDFVLRFQQITTPIMAKGMEDTTFYIQNRLVFLNEVGGDPEYFGYFPREFHRQNLERVRLWPLTLLPSVTHDTKRSQDVRMRIHSLTEVPELWRQKVMRWHRVNYKLKTVVNGIHQPDNNTEYLFYQTLVGMWPDYPLDKQSWPWFRQRLWEYFQKAVREAKVHTSWLHPDAAYEDALKGFIDKVLDPKANRYFISSFQDFHKKTSMYGKRNSLAALALRMCSPGIVDVYQGCELWCETLVDPDNRRPVDWNLRRHLLGRVKELDASAKTWQEKAQELWNERIDSRLKLHLTWKLLHARRRWTELFLRGEYIALEPEGPAAGNLIAFARRSGKRWLLCVVGRFLWQMDNKAITFDGTHVNLPEECPAGEWRDILWEGRMESLNQKKWDLGRILKEFPIAVLTNEQ